MIKHTSAPSVEAEKIFQSEISGETICECCGLVIAEPKINRGPEWRAFSIKENENRTRTGLPIRFSLPDIGLSTTFHPIDVQGKTRYKMYRLKRWNELSSPHTYRNNLLVANFELDKLCYQLNIPKTVQERTAIIYRKALKAGLTQGRCISLMIAASLYTMCRMNNIIRTIKEISYHSHIERKQIAKCYKMLLREMNLHMPVPNAKYRVSRIASKLDLSEKTLQKAIEILVEADKLKITGGKSPMGMAAAALHLASKMNGDNCTQKSLTQASGTSKDTIRRHYKDLKNILNPRRA